MWDARTVELEAYRVELTGYCYRMLGSAFEAEDAVQETMLRAWRASHDPARGSARTWLYAIATNICLDMLRSARRRARSVDLGPAATPGPDIGAPLPESAFVRPMPDARVLTADPADLAAQRESVRLAFVAALQHLPPRQRAVLILRDVLHWHADEVATLLDTTATAVHSALRRARATIRRPAPSDPLDDERRALLARYVDAFERYDVAALTALLHEDATMDMPPFAWYLRGRDDIRAALTASDGTCLGHRLLPAMVNGRPAFGQYDAVGQPFALVTLEVAGGLLTEMTTYLDLAGDFEFFGLPAAYPAATSSVTSMT